MPSVSERPQGGYINPDSLKEKKFPYRGEKRERG
jgi:hypothetical protein